MENVYDFINIGLILIIGHKCCLLIAKLKPQTSEKKIRKASFNEIPLDKLLSVNNIA